MKGLSLSFCVRDIIEGKVNLDDVEMITTGTCAPKDEDWRELVEFYSKVYWSSNPTIGKFVANHLYDMGKIYQPRVEGKPAPWIAKGHWE